MHSPSLCPAHDHTAQRYGGLLSQDAWIESTSPAASPFAAAAQRALADRPGSGSRVYRTATSPAASMSSYSSTALDHPAGLLLRMKCSY